MDLANYEETITKDTIRVQAAMNLEPGSEAPVPPLPVPLHPFSPETEEPRTLNILSRAKANAARAGPHALKT